MTRFYWSLPFAERMNVLTHGAGLILAIAGLALILTFAPEREGNVARIIFCASLIHVYLASVVYHSTGSRNKVFLRWDRAAVYMTVCASYFAIAELLPQTRLPFWVLLAVFAITVCGVIAEGTMSLDTLRWGSPAVIAAMIWLGAPFSDFFVDLRAILIFSGLVVYTIGGVFNLLDLWWPELHCIWHIFVLFASFLHFLALTV